jgi:chitosanase
MQSVVLSLGRLVIVSIFCSLVAAMGAETADQPVLPLTIGTLSSDQKRRAEQLTSLFENDTIELQYGYCTNLKDGRGFTAGRAGFVTCNEEVYRVVKAYTQKRPGNLLAGYLPRLRDLADQESSDTSGLKDFKSAWKKSENDPLFREVQDQLVEELFWRPALNYARTLKIRTPLAIAAIHDTIIQHGNDDDADGLPKLLIETQKESGGTPASGIDEKTWLLTFLKVRRHHLANASEQETREEWKKSLDRCLVFETIAKSENYDLTGPIVIKSNDYEATIP